MSDRHDEPTDLLDVVSRLDALAEWLDEDYTAEADDLRAMSEDLKRYIVIRARRPAPSGDQ